MTENPTLSPPPHWSRRDFIKGTTTLVSTLPLAGVMSGCVDPVSERLPENSTVPLNRTDPLALPAPVNSVEVHLTINGSPITLTVEPRVTLNDALRDRLGYMGTKIACDRAACGACTVHLNGRPVYSCTTLAVEADGAQITTIEGLADGDTLHAIQEAFIEQDALQCGFCTAGMIMSCKALLDKTLSPSDSEVKQAVSGNLCRCGTYPRVFQATLQAAETLRGG